MRSVRRSLTAIKSEQAGVDIKALEQAARMGLSNGAFEDSEDEATAVVEEFYPDATAGAVSGQTVVPMPTKLTDKLAGNEMAAAA